ncbi:MAG: hypothetical protein M0Z94_01855 [Dehalococcoidales bacterium]|nr:hypothetical protein [Dehalococcoidales bacterium]
MSAPPLPIELCLEARKLRLAEEPLEELLRGAGLRPTLAKLGAMLEARDRHAWVRKSLHTHQKKWAVLHEIGHDVFPWQREVLFYCSLSDLAPTVRLEFEIEVNAFAVE